MKHLHGDFKGGDGLGMYYQCWLPDKPKAILVIVHGLGEHSGRYGNLVDYFVPLGYGVYAYDLRGHGKSGGPRAYTNRFSNFIDDLDIYLKLVRSRHVDARLFLVGHSTGGTIATAYTIVRQQDFAGLILSGAILSPPSDASRLTILAARILARIMPRAGLYAVDAKAISRDKEVVSAYVRDPLVYHGKIRARLGVEIMKTMAMVGRGMPEIRLPLMIMHGGADGISNPESSQMLYRKAGSADKTLKIYQGCYHEIFNEPGRQQVFADMESWLKAHT